MASEAKYGGHMRNDNPDRAGKSVCRDCNRTVHMVDLDGSMVATETELIAVVPHAGAPRRLEARRVHADLCAGYVEAGRKMRIAAEKKTWLANQERRSAKPRRMRRDPGL